MSIATYPYDSAELLNTREAIAAFAEQALAEDDPDLIRRAIGIVARAHGYLVLTEAAGLPSDTLLDALHDDEPHSLETLRTVLSSVAASHPPAYLAAE